MESTLRNVLTPLSKVRLSVPLFSRNSSSFRLFLWIFSVRKFHQDAREVCKILKKDSCFDSVRQISGNPQLFNSISWWSFMPNFIQIGWKMQSTDTNFLTRFSKDWLGEMIFTSRLLEGRFVKNFCLEFNENVTNGLDTSRPQTDGRTDGRKTRPPHKVIFLLYKGHQINEYYSLRFSLKYFVLSYTTGELIRCSVYCRWACG